MRPCAELSAVANMLPLTETGRPAGMVDPALLAAPAGLLVEPCQAGLEGV